MNAELVTIERGIKDREETIDKLRNLTACRANELLAEVLLQGQALIQAKASLNHGEWLPWLAIHFPKTPQVAQAYMRLANAKHDLHLNASGSVRQALALLNEPEPASNGGKPQRWPSFLEGINRLSRFTGFITKNPIEAWPAEGLDQLREDLLPIASKLWPQKFEG